MIKVNIFEAKARLSEFLERAARGERIVVCRHNQPVAELRPVSAVRTDPRPIGPLPGRPTFDVPPAFFEPVADDELRLWEETMPSYPPDRAASSTGTTRVAERRTDRDASGPSGNAGRRPARVPRPQSKGRRS